MKYSYSFSKDLLFLKKEKILLCLYNAALESTNKDHTDKKPTLEDAKNAIAQSNGIIDTFCGEKINVNLNGSELNITEFTELYGVEAANNVIIEMHKQAISQNTFLNNLIEEADSFSIPGKYYLYYNCSDPAYAGIYFVCGYDANTVANNKLNLEQLYIDQVIEGVDKLDLHVEKLTGANPFNAHQNVIHYCQRASVIRALCNMNRFNGRINRAERFFVSAIFMMCRNMRDKNMSFEHREENREALGRYFLAEGPAQMKGETDAASSSYLLHVNPERISLFRKNMLSLENLTKRVFDLKNVEFEKINPDKEYNVVLPELLFKTGNMMCINVRNQFKYTFFNKLNEEKVYFTTAKNGDKTAFLFDAKYYQDVQQIFLDVTKRDIVEGIENREDFFNHTTDTALVGIKYNDIDKIVAMLKKANINFCISDTKFFSRTTSREDYKNANFSYDLAIPANQRKNVSKIAEMNNINLITEITENKEPLPRVVELIVKLESIDEIKKWLSKRPDVLYYQSKPVAAQLTGTAAETGFGGKANFFSSIVMAFDGKYQKEIEYLFLKASHPQYFKYSMSDIEKIGKEDAIKNRKPDSEGISTFAATMYDLVRIFINSEKFNIPMAINDKEIYYNLLDSQIGFNDNSISVSFPSKYSEKVGQILNDIAAHDIYDKVLPADEIERYNYNRPIKR